MIATPPIAAFSTAIIPEAVSPSATSSTILIIDDEPAILNALTSILEREGFQVVGCTSPLKALAILDERDFGVIISDQRMPEMMGLDFMVESRRLRPFSS